MRELLQTLLRNRRMIGLFGLMVLLPGIVFSVLIVRAVRSEALRSEYEKGERQKQIVRLVEADLNIWLFSTDPQSARAQAVLRFELDGDQIVFPEFHLSLPSTAAPRLRPFESPQAGAATTPESITGQYYPRIQAFLRDLRAGRHSGAQYFLRLKALVVRLPGGDQGYVVEIQPIVEHVNRKLGEFCAVEAFACSVWIADAEEKSPPAAEAHGLDDFPFFEVLFDERGPDATGLRRQPFPYAMGLLAVITLLGSLFVHRAVSHEIRLSQLRSDFVAAVSHEFRSPLSSILALVERLESERTMGREQLSEYYQIIGQDARRLKALVTRLLDFAQVEEGKKVYSLERLDLVTAAREAIDSGHFTASSARVRLMGAEAAPLWVRADRTALYHSIQNLIENAAKYSPADSPIEVTCASANGSNSLEVRDWGIGVSPSEQKKIFEKFYRGRQGSDLNAAGVGIGLALVRHVMEGHGGSVSVESRVGEGSRFCLRLPKAEA